MDRRLAAVRPSFDMAWLRVLVTVVLAVLAAALTVLASPEPATGAEGRCRSLKQGARATMGGACPLVVGWRTGVASR